MNTIGTIEVKGNMALAYKCAMKIWALPPWEAVEEALVDGNTTKIDTSTALWAEDHTPFSGPTVEIVTRIMAGRKDNMVRIITDTSERVIEIVRHGPYSLEMDIDFGKNGSIFAAGDLYARLRELDDKISVECWSPDGAMWQDDEWTPKVGMSHSRIASDWAWGKLTEDALLRAIENFEEVA